MKVLPTGYSEHKKRDLLDNRDLDLLLITRRTQDPSSKQLYELSKRTGRTVQLLRYTPDQWEKKALDDKPFYERVIIDGIAISGPLPVVAR